MLNKVNDGFHPELVETAEFCGVLEIPSMKGPDKFLIPKGLIPFTHRKQSDSHSEFLVFYEHDKHFKCLLKNPTEFLDEIRLFPGVVTPDCSLYRDMPFCLQVANIYFNRAIGHYWQSKGLYVVPNVRWGDERTYSTSVFPEKLAFVGLPKNSIVSIGTYGCIQGKENTFHFKEGLRAMLDELHPKYVLVYGPFPDKIFDEFKNRTNFISYPDWTSLKKGERK